MTTDLTVSKTILQQLGGRVFIMMTGSKNFVGSESALSFKVGAGTRDGITHVRVELTADDLYDITFMRVRGTSVKTISKTDGAYADMLRTVFEAATGFRVSL